MTLLEVIFALCMFAGSGAASLFAISTTITQLGTLEDLQAVQDATDVICAMWFASEPLPQEILVDEKVCKIFVDVPNDQGAMHFEVRYGKESQSIWLSSKP